MGSIKGIYRRKKIIIEFQTGGLNPKITSCNVIIRFFIGVAKWKCVIFILCPKLFVVKLYARNEAFRGMKGNVQN